MMRSASEIEQEAKTQGKRAAEKSLADNSVIQVLCALVEELASTVRRLEAEVQQLKTGRSHG